MAVQEIVFHHHQSLFCTLRLPFEGYIPFSHFLYLLFLDHVERVGLFILITASRNSFITYSSFQPASRPSSNAPISLAIMRFSTVLPVLFAVGIANAQQGNGNQNNNQNNNQNGNQNGNNNNNNNNNNGGNAAALTLLAANVQSNSNSDGLADAEAGQAGSKT